MRSNHQALFPLSLRAQNFFKLYICINPLQPFQKIGITQGRWTRDRKLAQLITSQNLTLIVNELTFSQKRRLTEKRREWSTIGEELGLEPSWYKRHRLKQIWEADIYSTKRKENVLWWYVGKRVRIQVAKLGFPPRGFKKQKSRHAERPRGFNT